MKNILCLIFLLFSSVYLSQNVGGRLREVQNQRKLNRTIFKAGWKVRVNQPNYYRKTEPDKNLFFRYTTSNAKFYDKLKKKMNKKRMKKRLRARNQFHKRKYT